MSDETTQPSETTSETTTEAVVENNGEATEQTTTYMDGKYDSISSWENGHKELQKSYTQKTQEYNDKMKAFPGSPEAYELADGIETTSRLESLEAWGKENGLSNEGLNSIIKMDTEATQKAQEAYVAEQKEVLGKDAETRLTNLSDWARAQVGEDMMDTFGGMITSAKGVEMMEGLMKQMQGTAPAPAQQTQTVSKESLNEMRFAVDKNSGERRMSIDPAYRAKVEALEAEMMGRG